MTTETKNLLNALSNAMVKELGTESINSSGVKYRYDHYSNKYQNTPYFLATLFRKAVVSVGGRDTQNTFRDGNLFFHFNMATLKGLKHGNITYKELVILS